MILTRSSRDQDHGVADQELHQHVRAVDLAHQQPLERHAEQADRQRRADCRHEVVAARLVQRQRDVGSDHVERAVCKVGDVEHAEDQRHARRDQEQQHANDQAAGELGHDAGPRPQATHQRFEIHELSYVVRRDRWPPCPLRR